MKNSVTKKLKILIQHCLFNLKTAIQNYNIRSLIVINCKNNKKVIKQLKHLRNKLYYSCYKLIRIFF